MQNVKMTRNGNKLTIEIDLDQDIGRSSTGKSRNVATTGGSVAIPGADGAKITLTVYKPEKQRKAA